MCTVSKWSIALEGSYNDLRMQLHLHACAHLGQQSQYSLCKWAQTADSVDVQVPGIVGAEVALTPAPASDVNLTVPGLLAIKQVSCLSLCSVTAHMWAHRWQYHDS